MGRIRTIKPEFPQSESIGALSRDARLLFIQLWTIADDSGRARAASRMLASLLYPYDDDAPALIGQWMAELIRSDLVQVYEVGGSRYLQIKKWSDHQKIDRPTQSKIPPFDESSRALDEPSTTDLGPRTMDQGKEKDFVGSEPAGSDLPVPRETKTAAPDPVRSRKPGYSEPFELFWTTYPRDAGMSKSEAWAEWRKLTPDEQAAATAGIPGFKTWVSKQGRDYRCLHACRYLKQRRFEGFAGAESVPRDKWERRLALGRKDSEWDVKNWGPMPNRPGCIVPQDLVKPDDGKGWSEWKSAA